ncbi:MAG TPA: methyltransferase domain-containing protein, partial [Gemmatimonadaceae bacterium]
AAFQQLPFVRRRAEASGVRLATVGDLGAGDFLPDAPHDSYDVVIFCEILEHITFHPALFWKRVYEILKPGGLIFLSTPNSLRISNWVKAALRLLTRRGVGISMDEIFGHVTYGHHWKEYSSAELRDYFARLSPDFQVTLRFVDPGLPRSTAAAMLQWLGNPVPVLRPSLEAIVRLPRKERWLAQAKTYDE